jgi:heterotetrameric sarcosine oxidase delta subunit
MLRINCPFCGVRDHTEFAYGGDGSIQYPTLDAPESEWHDAVFERKNIYGVQVETWQHVNGCRLWLHVERDTMTHKIHSVRPSHPGLLADAKLVGERSNSERLNDMREGT